MNIVLKLLRSQAKHANGEHTWGVNGDTGKIVDMKSYGLFESASVKVCDNLFPLFHWSSSHVPLGSNVQNCHRGK